MAQAKIQKIRHVRLATNYAQCKKRIAASTNPNEKLLYHGSINSHLIAEMGFDINLANPRGLFGPGIYFAEDAYKSAFFADGMVSKMLMCLVLLGNEFTIKQFKKFKQPPKGFNSVHGVKGEELIHDEYIVYDHDQALPRFVVTYDIL